MMTFKNLALATTLIIGGVSGNAVASTVTVSIEDEAPAAQTATFAVGDVLSVSHVAPMGQNETAKLQNATFPVGEALPAGHDEAMEQDAAVPFIHPVALPEPAVWDLMLIASAALAFLVSSASAACARTRAGIQSRPSTRKDDSSPPIR